MILIVYLHISMIFQINIILGYIADNIIVNCSAIWGLLDKDDDLRASHELLNTERILYPK